MGLQDDGRHAERQTKEKVGQIKPKNKIKEKGNETKKVTKDKEKGNDREETGGDERTPPSRRSLTQRADEALCSFVSSGKLFASLLGYQTGLEGHWDFLPDQREQGYQCHDWAICKAGDALPFFLTNADCDRCGELVGSISSEGLMDRPWASDAVASGRMLQVVTR